MKQIYISTSKISGKGIMAGENISKGEHIQYIKGTPKKLVIHNKKDSDSNPNWIGFAKNQWIDPDYPNQFLNHSCEPNCGIQGRVTMVALKSIKEGEEITIDYSITECDDMWEMKCTCGSKNCRKVVKSIQHLPESQFKKYFPYVPTYFKNLYITLHPKFRKVVKFG